MIMQDKYKLGVLLILIIIGLALVANAVKGCRNNNNPNNKTNSALDSVLVWMREQRKPIEKDIQDAKDEQETWEKMDSLMTEHDKVQQTKYNEINKKLSTIPAYIKRIADNDDSIRTAFAQFK